MTLRGAKFLKSRSKQKPALPAEANMGREGNLTEAVQAGNVASVKRLLDQGADPGFAYDRGSAPLSTAVVDR
jgi:hypothetical protein